MIGGLGVTLSKMTKPINAIKSTMSNAGAFGMGAYARAKPYAMKAYGTVSGQGQQMASNLMSGRGLGGQWRASTTAGKAGMIGAGAGALGGGAAAADFLNPWGLGWGD